MRCSRRPVWFQLERHHRLRCDAFFAEPGAAGDTLQASFVVCRRLSIAVTFRMSPLARLGSAFGVRFAIGTKRSI